jgi:2-dehydropantoate 2-reductase
MNICVFGAGSLGSALGGILSQKNDVVLVGRKPNMSAIRKNGLRLLGDRVATAHPAAYETVKDLDPPELLIISTKAFDTKNAVISCRSWAGGGTMVLTLQNGLGNLELLRGWKRARAFGGTTTMGANLVSPGVVRISGVGRIVIGSDLDREGAGMIASSLRSCGLSVSLSHDIEGAIWSKAIVNACINPTAAVLRVVNGKLLESAVISHFMRDVCGECELVADASGIGLPYKSMFARVQSVCRSTSNNISSMLQDVMHGRRTEIEQINGAFCMAGDKLGLSTPLNDALVAMVTSLSGTSRKEKG